jgi:hypothetical protein
MSARNDLVAWLRENTIAPDPEPLSPLEAGIGRAIENRGIATVPGSRPEQESWHDRVMQWVRAENAAAAAQGATNTPEHDPGPVAPLNGQQVLNSAASALRGPGANVTINAPSSTAALLRRHIEHLQQ